MALWGGAFWGRSAAVNRLTVLAAALFMCGIGIFARLLSLQVMQHEKYAALARSQQEHKIDIPAPRGSIYDRNGQVLALSVPADSVSVNPLQIPTSGCATETAGEHAASRSAGALSRLAWARENHHGFLWVKRRLDPFEISRLKASIWITSQFHPDSMRRYPE